MTERIDIIITAEHQAIAARLGLAMLEGDTARVSAALRDADNSIEDWLAVLAVQTRNLVNLMVMLQGADTARRVLEGAILEAGGLAGDE